MTHLRFMNGRNVKGGTPYEESNFDPMDVLMLPYGIWTSEKGTEVIFSRGYRGIWQRKGGSCKMIMKPKHISEIVKTGYTERFFSSDSLHNPRRGRKAALRCRGIIADFITGKSLDGYVIPRSSLQ